jgi:hypothetical protein
MHCWFIEKFLEISEYITYVPSEILVSTYKTTKCYDLDNASMNILQNKYLKLYVNLSLTWTIS